MRIRPRDIPAVAEPDNDLVLRPLLRGGPDEPPLSATWVRLEGRHRRLRTDASDRLYVVLDGEGTIHVDGTDHDVVHGDLVVVPRGAPYELRGTLTYLVLNVPAFREGDDIYLDS